MIQSHLGSRQDAVRREGSKSQILGGGSVAPHGHWASTEITAEHTVPGEGRQGWLCLALLPNQDTSHFLGEK